MAKLAGKVEGFEKRDGEDWDAWTKRTEALLNDMSKRSAAIDPESSNLVNAMIQFQVADGYAHYVVVKTSPLTLHHVPFLDGYQASAETIRGVNANSIRSALKRAKLFSSLTDENTDFYKSLRVGQVVHYHNGFGSWVRCEVVRGQSVHSPGVEQNVLKPIALVGDWRPYDLPKRQPDGSVRLGYHAEKVRDGETMTPHESTIWESPRCANKSRMLEDGFKDPSKLEPISLEVPGMSAEEERKAALWKKIAWLRALVNDHRQQDPQAIIDSLKAALSEAA